MLKRTKVVDAADIGNVSAGVICDLFGVSSVTFARWIDDGLFERAKAYDLKTICRALLKNYQRRASGRGEEGEVRVLASARARQALAIAEREELRNAVAKSQYVPLAAVRVALEDHLVAAREVALSLPGKTSSNLVGRDAEEIHEILENEIYEMLDRLANGDVIADEAVEHQRNGGVLKRDRRYRVGADVDDKGREGFVAHDNGHDLGNAFIDERTVAGRDGRPPRDNRRDVPDVLHQRDGGATFP
jgi:hypothetical protein